MTSKGPAQRLWQERVRKAGELAADGISPSDVDQFVLRVAYFYVYAPAGDLDNIVKPLQDSLKGIAFADDIQVVDIVASMRRRGVSDRVPMTKDLAIGFQGGSDFVHIVVDQSSRIEVFR